MSSTNTIQARIAQGFHALADITGFLGRAIPMEAQDGSGVAVAVSSVHDLAQAIAEGASSLPQTGITKEEILPDLVRAFSPVLQSLVAQEVARVIAAHNIVAVKS